MTYTRVTIVLPATDIGGREVFEYWADEWVMRLQDDHQTIKLEATGDGMAAKAIRDAALAKDLDVAWQELRRHRPGGEGL
jgi:hypothetical protein